MAVEKSDVRYFDFAIQTIASIPEFRGDRSTLDAFIRQMDAACAVAADVQATDPIRACLGFQFLNRISPEVQQAARISVVMPWSEARARLRDQYGGMMRPLTRHAWRAMNLERGRGERESDYAHRLAEEMRLLKRRILEAGHGDEETTWRVRIYEELGVENLRRNMSESTRKVIMSPKVATVEEATLLIEEEEVAAQEYRVASSTAQWVELRRKPRPNPHGYRAPFPFKSSQRTGGTRPPPPPKPRTEAAPVRHRARPECWGCGQEGHFKRECPHIFHRERRYQRQGYEPMEVNAGRRIWRTNNDAGYTSDEGSTTSTERRPSFADIVRKPSRDPERGETASQSGKPSKQ